MIQQRPQMSRKELMDSIQLALVENVPGGRNGPDDSMLIKANRSLSRIMMYVDKYIEENQRKARNEYN